jgi:hypothetical protein
VRQVSGPDLTQDQFDPVAIHDVGGVDVDGLRQSVAVLRSPWVSTSTCRARPTGCLAPS